jgi:DNA replication protein DnaC
MLGSALAPDFVTEGRSVIFSGKPGRGQTHLAIAVAYRAIQNGFDAFFTTAATLIDDLSAAFRDGPLAQALQAYTHPAVLGGRRGGVSHVRH